MVMDIMNIMRYLSKIPKNKCFETWKWCGIVYVKACISYVRKHLRMNVIYNFKSEFCISPNKYFPKTLRTNLFKTETQRLRSAATPNLF